MHKAMRNPVRAAFAGAFIFMALAVWLAVSVTAASAQSRGSLNDAVSALRGISTMTANFTQTDRKGQRLNGKLTLKRGGKIRFDYGKSANMLVISNGKSLYLVDYDVRQVERWPIQNSPLGALLDPSRDVARYGKLMSTESPNVLSVRVRDPKRPQFGMITMIFTRSASAPGGWQLHSWVALDAQNQRTTVKLSNQRYGVSVPDSAFTFKDPRKGGRR